MWKNGFSFYGTLIVSGKEKTQTVLDFINDVNVMSVVIIYQSVLNVDSQDNHVYFVLMQSTTSHNQIMYIIWIFRVLVCLSVSLI